MSVGNKAVSRLDLMTVYKAGPIRKVRYSGETSEVESAGLLALVSIDWSSSAHLRTGPSSLVTEIKHCSAFSD